MDFDKKLKILHTIRIYVFLCFLFGGMIAGVVLVFRPSYSNLEKRKLETLPAFNIKKAWNGEYFSKLSLWYSDTFPMRETLLTANETWNSMYGMQTDVITGTAQISDDIPVNNMMAKTGTKNSPITKTTNLENSKSNKYSSTEIKNTNKVNKTKQSDKESVEITEKDIEKSQTFGSIYVTKHRAFSLYCFSLKAADNYTKVINQYNKKLSSIATVYDILAPTSAGIYVDKKKSKQIGTSNQEDAFSYIYSNMDDSVCSVNVIDALKAHDDEYLYYRTDHHWTALGAYYAYEQFCNEKKIKANPISSFTKKEYKNFLGSYYAASNQSSKVKKNIDTVEAYVPMGTNIMRYTDKAGKEHNWPIINDVSKYNAYSKYSTFVAGDNPYSVISNKKSKSKESCVVIKESYGNAMIPFLVDHYKKIYIVDYRYYKKGIISLVKKKKIQDVIFINNAEAINNTVVSLLEKLAK